MPNHQCIRSEEIGVLKETVQILKDKVMGNGKVGLDITVPILESSVTQLTEEVLPDLRTAISGFTTFMTESRLEEVAREKAKISREKLHERRRTRNRWLLTSTLTILAIITTWLIATRGG